MSRGRVAGALLLLVLLIAARLLPADPVAARAMELGAQIERLFASEEESFEAVEALGKIKHPESVKILEDLLIFRWETPPTGSSRDHRAKQRKLRQTKESMAKIRAKVAEALGRIGYESSMPLLVRTIREDENAVVREYALKALLNYNDPSAVGAFEHTALNDTLEGNRLLGIVGMAKFPSKIDKTIAKRLIADDNIVVRLGAIKFLGIVGRADFLPFIVAAAYDENATIKRRTADVLIRFNAQSAADTLFYLARDKDSGTVISAVAALGLNDHAAAGEFLKLAGATFWEAAMITLKASFNKWQSLRAQHYDSLAPTLGSNLQATLESVKRKVGFRRQIDDLDRQTKKIKMSLTDWRENGKL